MKNKIEMSPKEYAAKFNLTVSAVYERIKAETVEFKQIGLTHWKKPKYVILVDS